MKRLTILFLSLFLTLVLTPSTSASQNQGNIQIPNNTYYLIAADGTFLGTLEGKYDTNSIYNQYGDYGSKYSTTSIWNQYGNYGGLYSQYSPFNQYTNTPPILVINGEGVGYFSVNRYLQVVYNPYTLERSVYPIKY